MANPVFSPKWWFEGTHVRVGVLERSHIVVLERSAAPAGEFDLAMVYGPAEKAISKIDRGSYGILIDVRAAPGRNDPEFEKRFEPYRTRLQKGFRRVAILVKSTAGKLQVQRHAREDKLPNAAFDDYAAAVSWLEEVTLRP